MSIEELFTSNIINIHCYTVCKNNGFNEIEDILSYFFLNKTFLNLKNCGNKTNKELIDLSLKYYSEENSEFDKLLLTKEEEYRLNNILASNFEILSLKNKNALKRFLIGRRIFGEQSYFQIKNFYNKILANRFFHINMIKHLDKKNVFELNDLISLMNLEIHKYNKNQVTHEIKITTQTDYSNVNLEENPGDNIALISKNVQKIKLSDNLSVRSLNVCNDNGLEDLNSILIYYQENKTFINLRNCGRKSDEELRMFCLKHIDLEFSSNFVNQKIKNPLIGLITNLSRTQREIINNYIKLSTSKLTNKSRNSIVAFLDENLSIENISDKIFSEERFNFLKIRNIGSKTAAELSTYIDSIAEYIIKVSEKKNDIDLIVDLKKNEHPLIGLISKLTRTQRDTINSFIEVSVNKLANKSRNSIVAFLDENLSIRNISDKIFSAERFNFLNIRNIGSKTAVELNKFIDTIAEFVTKVSEIENDPDLIALKNRFFIEKTFSISIIPDEILETQSIFKLADFLIKNEAIYQKNENRIFQSSFNIFNNQPEVSLDKLAKNLNLSKVRTKQIIKNCLEELLEKFQFIKEIDDDLYQKYDIDLNQKLIIVDDNLNNKINQLNNTNFSKEFNSFLIYSFYSDEFELIGKLEDVLVSKSFNSRLRHIWNNFYLVKKDFSNQLDFNQLAEDLYRRLNSRIEETYSFNFKGYLVNFLKNTDVIFVLEFSKIPEQIIYNDFEIIIDLNDNIVFERNTFKQVREYAIEALEKLGVPSKLEEIYILIEKENPQITKSQEALRGSLQRTPEIIYFGRSSTFGLKKWEKEKEGIKGGTIKDMILEYLESENFPIHILELVNEVHKFRDETNAKNIITNLKLDPQNRFIIFNQSFIGLRSKSYNSNLTNLPKFLGKTISLYIKQKGRISRLSTENYFSDRLGVSIENMGNIIEHLIVNKFIQIDNQNNLTL